MGETAYRIRLSVPLGQREGTLRLREDDGRISGFLEVMERKIPSPAPCTREARWP